MKVDSRIERAESLVEALERLGLKGHGMIDQAVEDWERELNFLNYLAQQMISGIDLEALRNEIGLQINELTKALRILKERSNNG